MRSTGASPAPGPHRHVPARRRPPLRDPHARHYSKADEMGRPVEVHDVTGADLSWAGAAGGMVSTTSDLHRFLRALLGGGLLPPALHEEMFTTVPTEGADWLPDTRYGLGVYCQRLPPGARSGAAAGTSRAR
ncbi:serine hydrolase [Nonomuraea antimicrobica]